MGAILPPSRFCRNLEAHRYDSNSVFCSYFYGCIFWKVNGNDFSLDIPRFRIRLQCHYAGIVLLNPEPLIALFWDAHLQWISERRGV